ncbi:MAG: ornithine carbamoyltransferase [Candidatus Diapherotrites archaeon]|uniref:Ornithine carbamoyltransferase n=1 Tax=Candidatus Iainarchaeum sp. TaxID=3101447 RepID=A0A939C8P0_9ARCH|nr:ornithine carbamoyltransferase [Candidatus Diapherotrites archaeon]
MNLLKLLDWDSSRISEIIELASEVKETPENYSKGLEGKTLAMLFQKTSTRTRASFEAGMTQLGGHAIYLDWRATNFTLGTIQDEVKCLGQYVDIIMARVFRHEDIEAISGASSRPVINGLCNLWHPCQALGDLLTLKEKKGSLKGLKLAYVGDGNNVCNSLIVGCSKLGVHVSAATPKQYKPLQDAASFGENSGNYSWAESPAAAVKDADAVYTDTWVSMGQEQETKDRERVFPPYQVNGKLMALAKKDAIFMHCLPAHRNREVADSVIDSKQSVVFDQAGNRLHVQKAVLLKLLGKAG